MTAWSDLPPAPPPHGTVLAWARGCRCDECEPESRRFVSELALRGPLRLPARPEPPKLDADTRARLEPAVSRSECPVCGAPPAVPQPGVSPAFRANSSRAHKPPVTEGQVALNVTAVEPLILGRD